MAVFLVSGDLLQPDIFEELRVLLVKPQVFVPPAVRVGLELLKVRILELSLLDASSLQVLLHDFLSISVQDGKGRSTGWVTTGFPAQVPVATNFGWLLPPVLQLVAC
jgi:hypothetical protein